MITLNRLLLLTHNPPSLRDKQIAGFRRPVNVNTACFQPVFGSSMMSYRLLLPLLLICVFTTSLQADTFDRYINPVLAKAAEQPGVIPIQKLTPELVSKHNDLFQETGAVLLVIRTNGSNNAKVLAQFAKQRTEKGIVPMVLLERATSYKPGQDRAIQAIAPTVHLYDGFQFHFDLGQVVPSQIGGDIRYVDSPTGGYLEAVGNAKLYLITRHLPGTEAKKPSGRTVLGEAFDPLSMAGIYKLSDDGRRQATLELTLDSEGNITGSYTSEQSGRKYDVTGKVTPTMKHQLSFTVKFPNTTQDFTGYVFTKDASAICGFTKMQGQEFGFYAVRDK